MTGLMDTYIYKILFISSDGPVLIHTTFGEILRALAAPDEAWPPQQLALSREGLVVVAYARGHLAAYTLNGRRLRHHTHNDNFQVSFTTSLCVSL